MHEWISGNVYIRMMGGGSGLAEGEKIRGHTHNFDHTSIFFNGRWQVKRWSQLVDEQGEPRQIDGEPGWIIMPGDKFERDGPFHLLIKAGCKHEFIYRGSPDGMPGRAWCIYSHRTPQGDVVEHWNGWRMAYE
jgi:hypothetical protein